MHLDSPSMIDVFMDVIKYQWILGRMGRFQAIRFDLFESKCEIKAKRVELMCIFNGLTMDPVYNMNMFQHNMMAFNSQLRRMGFRQELINELNRVQ
jgi:hypothetical protein